MSTQTSVKTPDQIGKEIENFIDHGQEEFLITTNSQGEWLITADRKKFWSWLLTPQEQEAQAKENDRIRFQAQRILDSYNLYVNLKEVDPEGSMEALHQINLHTRKLLL
jgi:hypothetical protein